MPYVLFIRRCVQKHKVKSFILVWFREVFELLQQSAPFKDFSIRSTMSGEITGYDSSEWYTVPIPTMEQLADDYLDGNALLDDLKFSGALLVPSEDNLQTTPTQSMNTVTIIPVEIQHRGPPERNVVDTPLNFTVEINSNDTNKKKYVYSHRLNRIYVDRECDFSVQFNWESALGGALWVRSCVVFADDAQAQKRPECCLQHLHQGSNTGVDKHIALNVLHSSRPMGTLGVEYRGSAEAADSWLSTVVALTKPGPEPVAHAYKFVCKSSCSSGINRRAIAIIFTLEDLQGVVYGRQLVGARVCSCPSRDMRKDEESEGVFKTGKKRVASNMTQPKSKKIKVETRTESERVVAGPPLSAGAQHTILPAMELMNDRVAIVGLEVMLAVTELAQYPDTARHKACIAKLKQTLQQFRDKQPTD